MDIFMNWLATRHHQPNDDMQQPGLDFLIIVQQGADALGHTQTWRRFALWAYVHGKWIVG